MIIVDPYKRKPKKRKRRSTGAIVNPDFPKPRSPGYWVNDRRCVCGDTYKAFRGAVSFAEAVQMIRAKAKSEGDEGGGYRSSGPALWVMRTTKLDGWYRDHLWCGEKMIEEMCKECDGDFPCRPCMTEYVIAFVESVED